MLGPGPGGGGPGGNGADTGGDERLGGSDSGGRPEGIGGGLSGREGPSSGPVLMLAGPGGEFAGGGPTGSVRGAAAPNNTVPPRSGGEAKLVGATGAFVSDVLVFGDVAVGSFDGFAADDGDSFGNI